MCIRLCAFVRAFTSVILGAADGDALGLALGEDGSETSGGHDGADASDAPGVPAGTMTTARRWASVTAPTAATRRAPRPATRLGSRSARTAARR